VCANGDLLTALRWLAFGAFVDWPNPNAEDRTALLEAIATSNNLAIHFLTIWNANIAVCDRNGWAPLHWAVHTGNQKLAALLLKRNPDIHARTSAGKVRNSIIIFKVTL
jgi:Arf-GAP/coiled-coil/ANK repeat/PH domain-containing protein